MLFNYRNNLVNIFLRFIKGLFIGAGTILPGISGGALAASLGLYERIIRFLANINKNFRENFYFFLPIGIGALFGIFILAKPIDYGLKYYPLYILWIFIGAIFGSVPNLYKQAGKKGRTKKHLFIILITMVSMYSILKYIDQYVGIELPNNFFTWLFAGMLFGSGITIPGLSTASLLIHFNLYHSLIYGIHQLNWKIIVPLFISTALSVIFSAKLMKFLLKNAYANIYHVIIGIVFASVIIILPSKELYIQFQFKEYFLLLIFFISGFISSYFLSYFEK